MQPFLNSSEGKLTAHEIRVLSVVTLMATFLMGSIDAYTFLTKNGAFVSAQTGNIVELAIKFAKGNFPGMTIHLISFAGYFLGVFSGEFIADRILASPKRRYILFLGIQSVLFIVINFLFSILPEAVLIFILGSIAGYGTSLFKQMGIVTVNNGAMTGNVKNLVTTLYRFVFHRKTGVSRTLRSLTYTILSFALGAGIGTLWVLGIKDQITWIFLGISLIQFAIITLFWD